MLFCCTSDLCGGGLAWLPFFKMPLGASSFLSVAADTLLLLLIFIVTRLQTFLGKCSIVLKSFVDLAKLFARLLLSDMRTDPLICGFILLWGLQFNKFSWNTTSNNSNNNKIPFCAQKNQSLLIYRNYIPSIPFVSSNSIDSKSAPAPTPIDY